MAIKSNQSVEELVAAGRYGDAAGAARDAGDLVRASDLYERIWEFSAAAACARQAGDLPRALRNAVDARDEDQIRELIAALDTDEGKRSAIDVLSQRRRLAEAAALCEEVGERERAIELYRSAHRDLDAARLLAEVGRDREAGRLLERFVAHAESGPTRAEAHLQLGLILARRMQHEEAVRHLQEAARVMETRARARRALVVELAALGLRDAARDVLVEARSDDPELPIALEEFLRLARPALESRPTEGAQIIAGRYRVEELIGSGGSGRVFRAHDEVTGREVALKMFHTAHARGTPAFERFVREARIASALRHPNLVEVQNFSSELGFLAMEYMVGGSLRDRLDRPLSGAKVRRMALDVCAGLEVAHQRGVIHRDVKPANIFFDGRGTAKLGDFGVAHLLDLGQTQTGGLIGTLAYMAPEQITGARLTIAADLYALGITLFEALTGRLPFLGPDFVAQHLGEPPPPLSTVGADLAPGWEPIVSRLLVKSPDERYDSIETLRRDILAVELGEAGLPRPLLLPRAPATGEGVDAATGPAQLDPAQPAGPARSAAAGEPRYQFETAIGRTDISSLGRALDCALDRSVIIERYDEGQPDDRCERRLYLMARSGGPYLQRALAYERLERMAVFEAPAGRPFGEAVLDEPLTPRLAIRLILRLSRAVAALHEAGNAHGKIDGTTVVFDDVGIPTLLCCGLGRVQEEMTPADDVSDILALVAGALESESETRAEGSAERLLDELAPGLSHPERAAILALGEPRTGEELYTFADAVEIAMLKSERRGRL